MSGGPTDDARAAVALADVLRVRFNRLAWDYVDDGRYRTARVASFRAVRFFKLGALLQQRLDDRDQSPLQ